MNAPRASCIAPVRAQTTEHTDPVLLAACVLRALPSSVSISHNIVICSPTYSVFVCDEIRYTCTVLVACKQLKCVVIVRFPKTVQYICLVYKY
jgi:hypothetical protein